MIVLTGREMAGLDGRAQAELGLPGIVLMENAGREAAAVLMSRYPRGTRVAIICGPGNNGGDGLAAGRHLALAGYHVEIWLGADDGDYKGDALTNLVVARRLGLSLRRVPEDMDALQQALAGADLIVDAFFGTGFHGAPRPAAAAVLRAVNSAHRPVAALDIPSGVEADTGAVRGEAIQAAFTITFAAPKLGCLLYPGAGRCGELIVAPISLPVDLLAGDIKRGTIEAGEVAASLPARSRDAHKGQAGHVLVIGGSPGLTGAPFLAARGALRAGAGLVTAAVPAGLPYPDKPAEAMMATWPAGPGGGFSPAALPDLGAWLERADVVAVGPGMGQAPETWEFLSCLLEAWRGPAVIDADALNLLAAHRAWRKGPRPSWILTPHPGEMARLAGAGIPEIQADRPGWAARLAAEWGAIVALKGVPTVIASPDGEIKLNTTGDPAMATGGMGDVLTGAIAALMAQGMAPDRAAQAGVYLHGLAGEMAARADGGTGILAGEVADRLPLAIREVKKA